MAITWLVAISLSSLVAADTPPSPASPATTRMVAIGDVHGAFEALSRLLQAAGVIDREARWSGLATELVFTGDLTDRGPRSRDVMDLVRRLEAESRAAGGQVHLTLGNHEMMNLLGDLRYVSAGEYAAFAGEETAERREIAYQSYAAVQARRGGEAMAREAFDAAYPAGFFAHRDAFSIEGEYGAWLLRHPLLLVRHETVFVHGGLPDLVAERGAKTAEILHSQLLRYLETLTRLQRAGILDPTDAYHAYLPLIQAFRERVEGSLAEWPEGAAELAAQLEELSRAEVLGPLGVLWYRGSVACGSVIEEDQLRPAFEALGARRLVIGHTTTFNGQVISRLDGRVLRIDTGMLSEFYGGRGAALILEGETTEVVYEDGRRAAPWVDSGLLRMLEHGPTHPELERALREGEIVTREELADGSANLVVRNGNDSIEATFEPASTHGFLPELAAYRLDRLLGMDMIPPTVERRIGGETGSLQVKVDSLSETDRRRVQGGSGSWCPLERQLEVLNAFDTLIFNRGRTVENIRYRDESWNMILIGQDQAFSTRRGRPSHLRDVEIGFGDEMRRRLESLDPALLETHLGSSLKKRQRRALLARRDSLLQAP